MTDAPEEPGEPDEPAAAPDGVDDTDADDVEFGPIGPPASFRRTRRGHLQLVLQPVDVRLLRTNLLGLLELLGDDGTGGGDEGAETDPLAAALGIGTETVAPADPALARLLPDAYADDPDSAADFRRYTEPTLRDGKRAAAHTVLATLEAAERAGGHKHRIGPDEAEAWLRSLNDLRLVLGERLDVTEDLDEMLDDLPDGDPRWFGFWFYERLSAMQESLVRALAGE